MEAYAYNRQVPGSRLQLTEGNHVRINFRNNLPEPTPVPWHGLVVPDEMDVPAKITHTATDGGGGLTMILCVEE